MKSKKNSKKKFGNSDIERNDFESHSAKALRKDKSSKNRLSIYDSFDDEFNDSHFRQDHFEDDDEEI